MFTTSDWQPLALPGLVEVADGRDSDGTELRVFRVHVNPVFPSELGCWEESLEARLGPLRNRPLSGITLRNFWLERGRSYDGFLHLATTGVKGATLQAAALAPQAPLLWPTRRELLLGLLNAAAITEKLGYNSAALTPLHLWVSAGVQVNIPLLCAWNGAYRTKLEHIKWRCAEPTDHYRNIAAMAWALLAERRLEMTADIFHYAQTWWDRWLRWQHRSLEELSPQLDRATTSVVLRLLERQDPPFASLEQAYEELKKQS